jgi:hypothetical protein
VKRAAGLWPQVVAFDALCRAADRAARGKRDTRAVAGFLERRELEVLRLGRALSDGTWRPSPAQEFVIHDPKRRTITAVPFADRVVHHALIAPLEPVFERRMIATSFACRRNKGMHRALRAMRRLVRGHRYALKLDVAAFFPSLAHRVVLDTLRRIVKDGRVLDLAATILAGPPDAPPFDRGLPIGSLTSQWFANVVLDRLDHFVKERLRVRAYLRYMDDFALGADDKATLHRAHGEIAAYLRDELDLALKERATRLAPTTEGVPWLGFLVFPGTVRVRPENLRRFAWRLRFLRHALHRGRIDEDRYRRGVASVVAHMSHADTRALRRAMFAREHTA